MECEILFRGKRLDNAEWMKGFYAQSGDRTFIIFDNDFAVGYVSMKEIIPATAGRYTGLMDKHGQRIFEGDIIAFEDTGEDGYEYKEGYDFTNVATVVWQNGRWELQDFGDNNSGVYDDMERCHEDFVSVFAYSEIIGNIHDNPELMEVQYE